MSQDISQGDDIVPPGGGHQLELGYGRELIVALKFQNLTALNMLTRIQVFCAAGEVDQGCIVVLKEDVVRLQIVVDETTGVNALQSREEAAA